KDSIHGYAGDATFWATHAKPCDRGPGEVERGLRARRHGFHGVPAAPSKPTVIASPTGTEAHRWVGFLVAHYRGWSPRCVGNRDRDRVRGRLVARGIARDGGEGMRAIA